MKKFIQTRKKTGLLFVKKLNDEIIPLEAPLGNPEIRKIKSQQDLVSLKINEELRGRIKFNLLPSKEVFVAIIDGQVVNASFIDYKYPTGVMLFGGFTLPEFRGMHINSTVKIFILNYLVNTEVLTNYLKEKGLKKVYISCAKDNLSSKASILRAGFKQLNFLERMIIKLKRWEKKVKFIIFT